MKNINLKFAQIFLCTIFLPIIIFIISGKANAQDFCITTASTRNTEVNEILKQTPFNDGHYCIRVYFHVIRKSDGTGGQTYQNVQDAFARLNQDFNTYNITFYWEGYIDEIWSSGHYFDPSPTIFNVNNHQDGVDIYLFGDDSPSLADANGIGESAEFYVSGSGGGGDWPYLASESLVTSSTISHEMGHVLFLWHTHQGTSGGAGCAELVDGSNSDICGDYVPDTPADPNMAGNVNGTTCIWEGSGTDANGHSYNPDESLIMSYSARNCRTVFSPMQVSRMKNAIELLPHLQQTLVNCCQTTEEDLYIKDSPEDYGTEPNTVSPNSWSSNDIWVRIANDYGSEHQNPEYNGSSSNYVYVRVANRGCEASTGNEQLEVYWTNANTASSWPASWNGTETIDGTLVKGGLVGTVNIPVIQPGAEAIVPIEWSTIPDPEDYEAVGVGEPWHFCLLARINSTNDPMTYPETENVGYNVFYNNNVASKNVTVINVGSKKEISGSVAVYNPYNNSQGFDLVFAADNTEIGKKIFQEAEVYVKLSDDLYSAWVAGGNQSTNVNLASMLNTPLSHNTFRITGDNAKLKNLILEGKESAVLALKFNFLTKEVTSKTTFTYYVTQKKTITNEVIGGNTFIIQKTPRESFQASANDISANKNEMVTLTVDEINEDAVYNWYDSEDNLIYTGTSLNVIADIAKTYKVEIIAEDDGYKDYADIEVSLNPHSLQSIAPNPSSSNISVNYNLNLPNSAYLSITGYLGNETGVSRNYILDTQSSQKNIDISGYATGYYTVALICDGQLIETINLIKQ